MKFILTIALAACLGGCLTKPPQPFGENLWIVEMCTREGTC